MVGKVAERLKAAMGSRSAAAAPMLARNTFVAPHNQWYAPPIAGASTFASAVCGGAPVRKALAVLDRLTPDAYSQYVTEFYRRGLQAFGDAWHYADINTAVHGLAAALQPESYLEIGVRRGRSLAMLAAAAPACRIVGCDLFLPGYAGMENPGPEFVRAELSRSGPHGALSLLIGDSHQVVPAYFEENPDAFFDLVTVDGDHSARGARADLLTVMPRVTIGGALVFDDVSHPLHPELKRVWDDVVVGQGAFSTYTFTEIGFGVGIAVRHA
jgi:predicted O-methyltransferase YrrM